MPKRTWDRDAILSALRERRQAGRDLSTIWMRDNDSSLFYSAINYFGTYSQALREAGIDPDSVRRLRRWSADRVIEELRRQHEAGQAVSYKALRRRDVSLLRAMHGYFPTYRDAVRAAGIDDAQAIGPARRHWTRQDILEELRQAHERGEDMSLRRFRASHSALVGAATGHFGSYAEAVSAAGISYAKVRRAHVWTEAEILAALQRRHRSGKDLSTAGMSRECLSLLSAAAYRFGTYRRAVEQAGIDYISVSHRVLEPWTRRQVLDGLRELHSKGIPLNEKSVAAQNRKLAESARRLFGSYGKAIQAAGFDYSQIRCSHVRVWSRNRIIRLLRDLYRQGADLRVSRIMKDVPGLASATCVYFGSYRKAVLAAGLKYPPLKNPGPWTAQRVLRALQERHATGGELRYTPLLATDESLVLAARYYFGTYQQAIAKAGMDYHSVCGQLMRRERGIQPRVSKPPSPPKQPRKPTWSAERVIADLRQLHDAGDDLHCEAVKKQHVNLFAAVYRRFASLHGALQAAGIPSVPIVHTHWDDAAVLDGIRAVYADGQRHSRASVNATHRGLWPAAEKHFGSWLEACRRAGIDAAVLHKPHQHWTRQLVLDELLEAHRLGKDLSAYRLNLNDPPLSGAMIRLFGSHRKALEAAGIDRQQVLRHGPSQSAEDVVNELRQVAQTAGTTVLTFAQVNRADRNLPRRAHYRFGSLKAAIEAAGLSFERRGNGRGSDGGHWNEQTVLDTLRRLQASGDDLRHRIMKQKNQSLFHAAKRLFGSYANAVEQAGINYWTMSQEHAAKERAAKEQAVTEVPVELIIPPGPPAGNQSDASQWR